MSGNDRVLLQAERLIDGTGFDGPGWVVIENGVIASRGESAPPLGMSSRPVALLTPGLVDLHVHGACGVDFAQVGTDPLPALRHHQALGATSLVASVATGTHSDTVRRLEELRPFVASGELAAIHLEGPWLSHERRGAHNPALLRLPGSAEIDQLLAAADGTLGMVTLAPELPGALAAVDQLVAAGVVVALGHTDADADLVAAAVDRGASVVTHLFNGMPPLGHREPGPVGVALADRRLTLELIADGQHVDDVVIDAVLAGAGDRTALVSDAMAATGLGDGDFVVAGSPVVVSGGVARLATGSSLAGSTTSLGEVASRLLARGLDSARLVHSAHTVPARALGLPVPSLRVGDRADLVTFAPTGERRAMRAGVWLS